VVGAWLCGHLQALYMLSKHIKLVDEITLGDLIRKPGWIRMSIHPTTTIPKYKMVCDHQSTNRKSQNLGFGL
jgi:hypothetical protein